LRKAADFAASGHRVEGGKSEQSGIKLHQVSGGHPRLRLDRNRELWNGGSGLARTAWLD
jgi:hypothetical protein